MKLRIFLGLLILSILPVPSFAANQSSADAIGISPSILEVEALPNTQVKRTLVISRSNASKEQLFTVTVSNNDSIVIQMPERVVMQSEQQQVDVPFTIDTSQTPLGEYELLVTFILDSSEIERTNFGQHINVGVAAKVRVKVVNQLTIIPPVQVGNTKPSTEKIAFSVPKWLWFSGGIVVIIDLIILAVWFYRKKQASTIK